MPKLYVKLSESFQHLTTYYQDNCYNNASLLQPINNVANIHKIQQVTCMCAITFSCEKELPHLILSSSPLYSTESKEL